jgi:hypothetical protein
VTGGTVSEIVRLGRVIPGPDVLPDKSRAKLPYLPYFIW